MKIFTSLLVVLGGLGLVVALIVTSRHEPWEPKDASDAWPEACWDNGRPVYFNKKTGHYWCGDAPTAFQFECDLHGGIGLFVMHADDSGGYCLHAPGQAGR